MGRNRSGARKRQGPKRDIVTVLELLPTEHQPHKRRVVLSCGHERIIFSHSEQRSRCKKCKGQGTDNA